MSISKNLRLAPQEDLVKIMQDPHFAAVVGIPSYAAMAELARRKEVQKAAAPKQAAPTQTVAQQMVAEAEPGVAGLPVPDQMFQEKSMAAGGIVAFDDGGEVKHFDGRDGSAVGYNYYADPYRFSHVGASPDDVAYYKESDTAPWADKAMDVATDVGKWFMPWYAPYRAYKAVSSRIPVGYDPKTGKPIYTYDTPVSKQEALDKDIKLFNQAQAPKEARNPVNQAADRAVIQDALNANNVSDAYLPGQGQRQFPNVKDKNQVPPKTQAEQGTRDRAFTPSNFDAPTVSYTPVTFDQKAFDAMKEELPTAQAERDRFKELVGENAGLAALQERLKGMEAKAAKSEEQAPWMALAKAGLGMAAGKSKFAVQNIAEGAQMGLADYAAAKDKLAAAEEKRFALQSQLAQAERAEQLAAAKFGEDSVQHIKAQNRATDLAALSAKTTVETTNASNELKAKEATAKNAVDVAQLRVTEKHYNDWYNVSLKTAEKSLQGIEKQGIQQQTQILNNLLDEANTQIKNLATDMNATPQDRINAQAKYDAIQQRLMSITGVQYTPKQTAGPRQKPLSAF